MVVVDAFAWIDGDRRTRNSTRGESRRRRRWRLIVPGRRRRWLTAPIMDILFVCGSLKHLPRGYVCPAPMSAGFFTHVRLSLPSRASFVGVVLARRRRPTFFQRFERICNSSSSSLPLLVVVHRRFANSPKLGPITHSRIAPSFQIIITTLIIIPSRIIAANHVVVKIRTPPSSASVVRRLRPTRRRSDRDMRVPSIAIDLAALAERRRRRRARSQGKYACRRLAPTNGCLPPPPPPLPILMSISRRIHPHPHPLSRP
jgi:hypothetical protein